MLNKAANATKLRKHVCLKHRWNPCKCNNSVEPKSEKAYKLSVLICVKIKISAWFRSKYFEMIKLGLLMPEILLHFIGHCINCNTQLKITCYKFILISNGCRIIQSIETEKIIWCAKKYCSSFHRKYISTWGIYDTWLLHGLHVVFMDVISPRNRAFRLRLKVNVTRRFRMILNLKL